jgi:hypothetical protein
MSRPVGVTLLSAIMTLAGLVFAGAGVVFFFMGSTAAAEAGQVGGSMAAALLAALGAAAGVIFLLFGGLHVVLAVGIFRMRNLARVLTIFLFVLMGAGASLGLIATLMRYSQVGLAWNLSLLVLVVLALWYLLRPNVKEAFGA